MGWKTADMGRGVKNSGRMACPRCKVNSLREERGDLGKEGKGELCTVQQEQFGLPGRRLMAMRVRGTQAVGHGCGKAH